MKNAPATEGNESAANSAFYFPEPDTVIGRVLGAMLRRERLTHKDCWVRFGSSRLSHHIYQLGKDGWPVSRAAVDVVTSDAKRPATIAEYWLDASTIQVAGERGQKFAAQAHEAELRRRSA